MENTPEKIAKLYLRLNGFFTMSHFTILVRTGEDSSRHIDMLALKPKGSREKLKKDGKTIITLKLDDTFFEKIGNDPGKKTIGLIVEVKGNDDVSGIRKDLNKKYDYLKNLFGDEICPVKVGFANVNKNGIDEKDNLVIVPIKYAFKKISERFDDLEELKKEDNLEFTYDKANSWNWSDSFLADLLYIKKIWPKIFNGIDKLNNKKINVKSVFENRENDT